MTKKTVVVFDANGYEQRRVLYSTIASYAMFEKLLCVFERRNSARMVNRHECIPLVKQ